MDPITQTPTPPAPSTIPVEPNPKPVNLTVIILSLLLVSTVSLAGYFAWKVQILSSQIASLEAKSPVTTSSPTQRPDPSSTPVATINPTVGWKTYTGPDFSYKYPNKWITKQNGLFIVADKDGASITNFSKDVPMYNECMNLGRTETIGDKMIKYYGYIYSGEACSNKENLGNYEAWITKAGGNGFQPGIIYSYNTTTYPESFEIFKQILSTFEFTE